MIKTGLDKCGKLRSLDFKPNYTIKYHISSARRSRYLPISLEKLKTENRHFCNLFSYVLLYSTNHEDESSLPRPKLEDLISKRAIICTMNSIKTEFQQRLNVIQEIIVNQSRPKHIIWLNDCVESLKLYAKNAIITGASRGMGRNTAVPIFFNTSGSRSKPLEISRRNSLSFEMYVAHPSIPTRSIYDDNPKKISVTSPKGG